MPQSANINDIRILRINYDPADLTRVFQSDVSPGRAAISGFVNSVAGREVLTNVGLAGPGINNFRIGGSDGKRTDRAHRLAIKNRRPDNSRIDCFPDPPIDPAEIKSCGVARHSGDGNHASATERTDHAPFKSIYELWRNRLSKRYSSQE